MFITLPYSGDIPWWVPVVAYGLPVIAFLSVAALSIAYGPSIVAWLRWLVRR